MSLPHTPIGGYGMREIYENGKKPNKEGRGKTFKIKYPLKM
jgi:hypothetical protein